MSLNDFGLARSILGDNLISADEIMLTRNVTYTKDQFIELKYKIPDQATLESIRDAGMFLVAGPPTAMNILDVRALHTRYFNALEPDADWYEKEDVKCTRADKIEALRWIAFCKKPVKGSLNKNLKEQQKLITTTMVIPNAAEAAWALTAYKAVHNVCLLDKFYVRTGSTTFRRDMVSSLNGALIAQGLVNVCIGNFTPKGVSIRYCYSWEGNELVGLAAGRKF